MPRKLKATRTPVAAIILLLLLSISVASIRIEGKLALANPATIVVPRDYQSIQEAINAAQQGDTILVEAGTYYYQSVIVDKSITLMGESKNSTFIIHNIFHTIITITANNVNVSGFTINGGFDGIHIQDSNMTTISNNTIKSSWQHGVHLASSHRNTIISNTISLNNYSGIFVQSSNLNLLNDNVVTNNVNVGIDLKDSKSNTVSYNTITFQDNATLHAQGIYAEGSDNSTIYGNIVLNNARGIEAYASFNNTVQSNIISNNEVGIGIEESSNNVLHHNNLINNTLQVDMYGYPSLDNWDNGTQGNYWSDYNGTDTNHDGIGETPYIIDENNQDRFPLVPPWSPQAKDVTAPITTNDYDCLWHNKDFRITLAAGDFSGINATYYIVNQASSVSSVSKNGQPLITTESANNTLEYWSVDGAGNSEAPHKILTEIKLDKTPPFGSILINDGDTVTTSPSVTLTASADDTLSGISKLRLNNDEQYWTPWTEYATTKAWNLSNSDGLKTVNAQFMDQAGLVSQICNDGIILDTAPPTLSILSPSDDSVIRSTEVTIQWNGTDAGVGIDHYEARLDNGSWKNTELNLNHTFTGLTDGIHTVYIKAFDRLLQSQETSVDFVVNTSSEAQTEYIKEAAIVLFIAIVLGIVAFYGFKTRRARSLEHHRSRVL